MSPLHGKTVLLVDDEAFLREALREEVETLGARGLEAENGRSAIAQLEAGHVDVVVSDLRMAGGTGLELLQKAPSVQQPCPPFVLLTGATEIDLPELHSLGAWAILEKPVSLQRLRSELEKAACEPRTLWNGTAVLGNSSAPETQRPQTMLALTAVLPPAEQAIATGKFSPGRGGFFLQKEDALLPWGSRVKFQLQFASGEPSRLTGVAVVRWTRQDPVDGLPRGYGLEIESLDGESLVAWSKLPLPTVTPAFIPKK